MQWINNLTKNKIPFYIYKLNTGDSLLYLNNKQQRNTNIIINGIVYLIKVFTNNETTSVGIFNKNHIISQIENEKYYYYSIVALEPTFIISFKLQDIINNEDIKQDLIKKILIAYQLTHNTYAVMHNIYTHKYTKHRLIQLILFLSKEFGYFENNKIIIRFHISQITLSIIIGSNRSTVNKIMSQLYNHNIISYHNQKYICIHKPFILI